MKKLLAVVLLAALLCGVPQKPNRYNPKVYPEAAKNRQKIVLDLLVHHKLITADEAPRLSASSAICPDPEKRSSTRLPSISN